MKFQDAIDLVCAGNIFSDLQLQACIEQLFSDQWNDCQKAAFLLGLRTRGESVDELVTVARYMRAKGNLAEQPGDDLIDMCGTGGDNASTFNISTFASFVVAGAGVKVAKHGNRAVSSTCGSSQVLEAMGVKLGLSAQRNHEILQECNIAFYFAPVHYPLMAKIAPVRANLQTRTLFNILGPMINPARAQTQLIGVFSAQVQAQIASCLIKLGAKKFAVVYNGCLDEIALHCPTEIIAYDQASGMSQFTLNPLQLQLKSYADLQELQVSSVDEALRLGSEVLEGRASDVASEIVVLNAAYGLLLAGKVDKLQAGLQLARESLYSGAALASARRLIQLSNQ